MTKKVAPRDLPFLFPRVPAVVVGTTKNRLATLSRLLFCLSTCLRTRRIEGRECRLCRGLRDNGLNRYGLYRRRNVCRLEMAAGRRTKCRTPLYRPRSYDKLIAGHRSAVKKRCAFLHVVNSSRGLPVTRSNSVAADGAHVTDSSSTELFQRSRSFFIMCSNLSCISVKANAVNIRRPIPPYYRAQRPFMPGKGSASPAVGV